MSPETRAAYELGLLRYVGRDFDGAIAAFEAGRALEPRRELIFAEAQAFRLKGDCAHATVLYREFLATRPAALQAEAAQLGLDRCHTALASPVPSPRPLEPRAAPPAATAILARPRPLAPTPARPSSPWRDPLVWGPFAGAAAAAATGAAFWWAADRARPTEAPTPSGSYDAFDAATHRTRERQTIAGAAFAASGALGAIGVLRAWWLWRREETAPRPGDASGSAGPLGFDGRALTWSGVY